MIRLAHRQKGNYSDRELPSIRKHRRRVSDETSSPFGRAEYRTENNQGQIDKRISHVTALAISSCARPWSPVVEDEVLAGPQMPGYARHPRTAHMYDQTGGNALHVKTRTRVVKRQDDWDVTTDDVMTADREAMVADGMVA